MEVSYVNKEGLGKLRLHLCEGWFQINADELAVRDASLAQHRSQQSNSQHAMWRPGGIAVSCKAVLELLGLWIETHTARQHGEEEQVPLDHSVRVVFYPALLLLLPGVHIYRSIVNYLRHGKFIIPLDLLERLAEVLDDGKNPPNLHMKIAYF
jgi:hypothetical protein